MIVVSSLKLLEALRVFELSAGVAFRARSRSGVLELPLSAACERCEHMCAVVNVQRAP
jgi:hypothetical protein